MAAKTVAKSELPVSPRQLRLYLTLTETSARIIGIAKEGCWPESGQGPTGQRCTGSQSDAVDFIGVCIP